MATVWAPVLALSAVFTTSRIALAQVSAYPLVTDTAPALGEVHLGESRDLIFARLGLPTLPLGHKPNPTTVMYDTGLFLHF